MEDINAVVERVVERCAEEGAEVNKGLAAFVAKTVVLEDAEDFQLNKSMSEEDVELLVQRSVKRLLLHDSPQMETIRMQVDFDSVFVETEEAVEASEGARQARLKTLKTGIVSAGAAQSGGDFEAITVLYRQIFAYLLCAAQADTMKNQAVEREIAAALESVFPKIGLKAFMALDASDQEVQLSELANIVMGIRLFNRRLGKGGVGIKDAPDMARHTAQRLLSALQDEREETAETCSQYSSTLVYVHRCRDGPGPGEAKVGRWQQELGNRRQYLAFLGSLEDDALHTLDTINKLERQLDEQLDELKELVGSRTSVPKEKVYPKFDLAAEIWHSIEQELELIESRQIVWATLQRYRDSCGFTIDPLWVQRAADDERDDGAKRSGSESKIGGGAAGGPKDRGDVEEEEEESKAEDGQQDEQAGEPAVPEEKTEADLGLADEDRPVLLTQATTPDFLNLPLEYQGYCPWTAATRHGLLLPGDPTLGVVSYRGTYQVFQSSEALAAFMRNPEAVISQVLRMARRAPELIQLLELQHHFPETALHNFLRTTRACGKTLAQAGHHARIMVDAATETPLHFRERHIDPSYEWNEWSLRRKALQLVNLRNARTTSSQTVKSHFRRENESQVYLPRASGTQTGISKATNPPRVHQYLVGLRGVSTSRFTRQAVPGRAQALVRLEYEL